jgi:sugar phosphate isomerase/epimerase
MNKIRLHNSNHESSGLSRRSFLGTAATVAAALSVVPVISLGNNSMITESEAGAIPDSRFGGVQIGAISYSWRSMPGGIDNIIKYCQEAGLSSLELMSGDVESDLGAPKNPLSGIRASVPPAAAPQAGTTPATPPPAAPQQRRELTPEQQAEVTKYNQDLKQWRLSVPMSKFAELGKKFKKAGIKIHIVKFSPSRWSDEEIDYAFKAAKAMGAKGVTDEIGEEAVKKLGPIAARHGMYAIFHNHMQFATPGFSYDPFLAVSPAVMMNFDAGHFFGSTGIHPNTIIEKYHDRIFSIHLKDKTGPNADQKNTNQVWGQGEAPIADILLLLKNKKWPIHVDIELEYEVKPWSSAVKETRTCVQFARQILI